MTRTKVDEPVTYDPNRLFDVLIDKLQLKNDTALSQLLDVGPEVISKFRHRRLPVGPVMLIRMHEISELTIAELRTMMGDRRKNFRINGKPSKSKKNRNRHTKNQSRPQAKFTRSTAVNAKIIDH